MRKERWFYSRIGQVTDGGTGASDAATARANLGLAIGTNVQAWDNDLDDIAALTPTDSNFIVGNGTDWVAESGATARTSLGVAIGSDVQAWDDDLDNIAALTPTDSNIIVGNGTDWVAESGATARTSLGVGTGDSPQFTGIELGHATDTTLTRVSAGLVAVEGSNLIRASDVDDTPVNGETAVPVSSNWAYDHTADADAHKAIRYLQAVCFDFTTDCATGDGKMYWHIPPALNGMNLVYCHAEVITAGTTGTMDIQIHELVGAVDMLSTKLTVDTAETGSDTAATPYVIDTANDDVATNDVIRIDVDAVHTTPAKGLVITLGFQTP